MAVVRVKRSCSEEPLDLLLLASKRRKTEQGEVPVTSLFKFAATVNNQEDSALQLAHRFKADAEKAIKKEQSRYNAILEKARKENKAFSSTSRYKVVNCYRALDESQLDEESDEKEIKDSKGVTVLEVESSNLNKEDQSNEVTKTKPDFVYDIYYAESTDLSDLQLDHIYSVHPMESELVFDGHRNPNDSDEDLDDEDDSNDENNWRNDYPDEEENDSDDGVWGNNGADSDDDDRCFRLVSRMKRCNMDEDGEELSSEDELYSGDLSPSDVNNYGTSYAKYKAKINRSLYDSSCSVNDSD